MPRKLQIQLPKPCHEDWNKMTPAEQGRFCNSCQKAVVDFTGMSDAQLVAFFKKPSTGSVCGRFDNDQLGRNLSIPGKRMPWLKYFLQLLVPTFLFACKARTQGTPRLMGDTVLVETKKIMKDKNGNAIEEKVDLKKMKGKVFDEKGIGIPHATVMIKGTRRGVMADIDGNYEIDLSGASSNAVLSFSAANYNAIEISLSSFKQRVTGNISLTPYDLIIMGETVVIDAVSTKCKKEPKRNN